MKLYHASNVIISKPDILHSREALDFGKGFYLTPFFEQAVSYAQRFKRRGQQAWVNYYEFNANLDEWKNLVFDSYSREWLDFVGNCRAEKDDTPFDIVIGGVANDKVIRTLDRYFEGEISAEQALGLLVYEKPNLQYCIRSQEMLNRCLKHVETQSL